MTKPIDNDIFQTKQGPVSLLFRTISLKANPASLLLCSFFQTEYFFKNRCFLPGSGFSRLLQSNATNGTCSAWVADRPISSRKVNRVKKRAICGFTVLFIVFVVISGAFAEITWTWPQHDNPVGTEYRQRYGDTQAIPEAVLSRYRVPDSIAEREMKDILPVFTSKKAIGEPDKPGSFLYMPRHEEIQAFIRDLANSPEGRERMRIKPLGEYPEGMPLTLAVFSKPAHLEPEELKALGKPIVWMHGAVHANEQDAVNSLTWIMYKLATGQWDSYLEKASVVLFLRVNADGAKLNIRGNPTRPDKVVYDDQGNLSSAIDLNRDSAWLEAPVLRVLHSAWSAYYPHISVGLHQMWSATNDFGYGAYLASKDASGLDAHDPTSGRVQLWIERNPDGSPQRNKSDRIVNAAPEELRPSETYYYPYDVTYAIGDHGNVPAALRSYFYDNVVPAWSGHMKSKSLGLWYYLEEREPGLVGNASGDKYYIPYTGDDGKQDGTGVLAGGTEGLWLDTGNMNATTTLKGAMGILAESRSPWHYPWTYPRRVYAQSTAMEGLIKYAAENAKEVMRVISDARSSIEKADKVYTLMKYADTPYIAEDVEYYNASGDIVKLDVPFYSARTVSPRTPDCVRTRPYAYILPKSEVNAVTAARLGFHGVRYHQLLADTTLSVEVFESVEKAPFVHPVQNYRKSEEPGSSGVKSADLVPWTPGFFVKASPPVLKSVTVPKGSFVFYTAQPLGAYLAAVMEPDAERSFARLTMSRPSAADDSSRWSVPYRYMTHEELNTKEVIQYYPPVDTATVVDVRPITGPELDALNGSATGIPSGTELAMAQDMDIVSNIDGFVMQLPASAGDFTFYAWNWKKTAFEKLEKATTDYAVANAFIVTTDHLGPVYESALTKGMGTNTVRLAAHPGEAPAPDPKGGSDSGCSIPGYGYAMFALICMAGLKHFKKTYF